MLKVHQLQGRNSVVFAVFFHWQELTGREIGDTGERNKLVMLS